MQYHYYEVTILTRPEDTTYWKMRFNAKSFEDALEQAQKYLYSYHEVVKIEKEWHES